MHVTWNILEIVTLLNPDAVEVSSRKPNPKNHELWNLQSPRIFLEG